MEKFKNLHIEMPAGIVMATYKEAVPFLHNIDFQQILEKPFPVHKAGTMFLIISGIGKTNSAIATSYLKSNFHVTCLINLGAAGSTTSENKIGDILHIEKSIEYDSRQSGPPRHKYFIPDTLEGFPTATLSTHDVPVMSHEDREKIAAISSLVDMEGSAFIQASRAFNTRAYLYKIVTDVPGNSETMEIIDNMKLTRDTLYRFFMDKVFEKLFIPQK